MGDSVEQQVVVGNQRPAEVAAAVAPDDPVAVAQQLVKATRAKLSTERLRAANEAAGELPAGTPGLEAMRERLCAGR